MTKKKNKQVKTGSKSDNNKKPSPNLPDRGIGSSFAYAVDVAKENARNLSKEGFLGQEVQVVDPKQYSHSIVNKD